MIQKSVPASFENVFTPTLDRPIGALTTTNARHSTSPTATTGRRVKPEPVRNCAAASTKFAPLGDGSDKTVLTDSSSTQTLIDARKRHAMVVTAVALARTVDTDKVAMWRQVANAR